jgi:hypothetical protein
LFEVAWQHVRLHVIDARRLQGASDHSDEGPWTDPWTNRGPAVDQPWTICLSGWLGQSRWPRLDGDNRPIRDHVRTAADYRQLQL